MVTATAVPVPSGQEVPRYSEGGGREGGKRGDFRDIWPLLTMWRLPLSPSSCVPVFLARDERWYSNLLPTCPETAGKQAGKQTSELPAPWGFFFYSSI